MVSTSERSKNKPSDDPCAFQRIVHVRDHSTPIGNTRAPKEPLQKPESNEHVDIDGKCTWNLGQGEQGKSHNVNRLTSECLTHGRKDKRTCSETD
jgi:hypothetical protein